MDVSGAPLAPFSHFCYSCVMSFLFLHVLFISFRVCFPGRPDSRMYCPDIIGRDSWVWDKQKTLYKTIPPTGWGSKRSRQGLSTLRNLTQWRSDKVIVVVVVVVESYCFLINIIVDPGGPWPPAVY